MIEFLNKLEPRFDIDDPYGDLKKEEDIEKLEIMKRNLAILGYEFKYDYKKDPLFDEESVSGVLQGQKVVKTKNESS